MRLRCCSSRRCPSSPWWRQGAQSQEMESRDGMGSRVYDVASRLFFRKLKMFTLKDIFDDPKENIDCSLACFYVSWMCVVSK